MFDSIVNSNFFKLSEFLIFFTNVDLFREKIEAGERPIKNWFPAYKGPELDAERGMDFFTDLFLRLNKDSERCCIAEYTHGRDRKILPKLRRCLDIAISQRGAPPAV